MKKSIKKLPKSQVAIEVSIPNETFESYYAKAVAALGEHAKLPGFRKGKIPANILEKEIPSASILQEMADMAINEHFPGILKEEGIDAIGRPMISITKIARGSELEFTATVAILPKVELPDYKEIAKKFNAVKATVVVEDAELDMAIVELKRARKHQEMHNNNVEHNEEDMKKDDGTDSSLTDEEVKQFGPFDSVEQFREKFRENIATEKTAREREKRRITILEEITAGTTVELPEVIIESEAENLMARMKADIANAGMDFEDYLTHIKKTELDIRTELMPDAEKRAKSEFVLLKIGEKEKLAPKQDEIEHETKRLMEVYKDADVQRARMYVTQLLANEEIFRFLEAQ